MRQRSAYSSVPLVLSLICWGVAPSLVLGQGTEAPESTQNEGEGTNAVSTKQLPPGVMARVNGRDITVDEYANYLIASIGKSRLDEYVNRLLVDGEASRKGIVVEPQAVEEAVTERLNRILRSQYQGDKKEYEKQLAKRRTSWDDEKGKLRVEMYYEMLTRELILKRREIAEKDLRRAFDRTYGEGGVEYVLQDLLVSTRPRISEQIGPAKSGEGGRSAVLKRRTPAEARKRAEKILSEIRGGLEFAAAVKKYSDDRLTRRNEGRLPKYRKGRYGAGFDAAVVKLSKEKPLSDVVESPGGYHILRFVEKRVTRFEDVKKGLETTLKDAAPSATERHTLILDLRKAAKVEGL